MTRVGIIGIGNVGASLCFSLAVRGICDEVILKDLKQDITSAIALDLSQGACVSGAFTKVTYAQSDQEFCDCDVIVVTAGMPRKPGMSRDDLLLNNAQIMTKVVNEIKDYNKDAIYIVVSNPLDAMVYTCLKATGLPRNKVIGMAGVLDSARMAYFISEELESKEKNNNIQASVMGGHGDDMVPLINYSSVDMKPLKDVLNKEQIERVIHKTRNGGAQIVNLRKTGSAYYAPAFSATMMINTILKNTKRIYPCAVMLDGEYGYKDVVAGVPMKLGENGCEKVIELELDKQQREEFAKSISSVQELIDTLDSKFFK